MAWVELHIQEFGGDPGRIMLMGHSAGAQFAGLIALDPSYLARARAARAPIKAFVGLSGRNALVPAFKRNRAPTFARVLQFLAQFVPNYRSGVSKEAAPPSQRRRTACCSYVLQLAAVTWGVLVGAAGVHARIW